MNDLSNTSIASMLNTPVRRPTSDRFDAANMSMEEDTPMELDIGDEPTSGGKKNNRTPGLAFIVRDVTVGLSTEVVTFVQAKIDECMAEQLELPENQRNMFPGVAVEVPKWKDKASTCHISPVPEYTLSCIKRPDLFENLMLRLREKGLHVCWAEGQNGTDRRCTVRVSGFKRAEGDTRDKDTVRGEIIKALEKHFKIKVVTGFGEPEPSFSLVASSTKDAKILTTKEGVTNYKGNSLTFRRSAQWTLEAYAQLSVRGVQQGDEENRLRINEWVNSFVTDPNEKLSYSCLENNQSANAIHLIMSSASGARKVLAKADEFRVEFVEDPDLLPPAYTYDLNSRGKTTTSSLRDQINKAAGNLTDSLRQNDAQIIARMKSMLDEGLAPLNKKIGEIHGEVSIIREEAKLHRRAIQSMGKQITFMNNSFSAQNHLTAKKFSISQLESKHNELLITTVLRPDDTNAQAALNMVKNQLELLKSEADELGLTAERLITGVPMDSGTQAEPHFVEEEIQGGSFLGNATINPYENELTESLPEDMRRPMPSDEDANMSNVNSANNDISAVPPSSGSNASLKKRLRGAERAAAAAQKAAKTEAVKAAKGTKAASSSRSKEATPLQVASSVGSIDDIEDEVQTHNPALGPKVDTLSDSEDL